MQWKIHYLRQNKIFTYPQKNSYQSFQATNTLDIQWDDSNHDYVLGLTINITTVVSIMHMGHGCEQIIYAQLIIFDLYIDT